jgi:type II secretory pathway pseudopilin PulG
MLFVTLLALAAAAVAPRIAFQIRRDREEELIHRGVQYSRAIRRYVKKTGGYPVRIEQLENTNNMRFLRKRYKDPITGQDFKILHLGDVKLTFGPGIAGANAIGGANPAPGKPALG